MKKNTSLILVIISLFLVLPSRAFAAGTLYLSPQTSGFYVGKIFEVLVLADSKGQGINTVEANLTYSSQTLELQKVEQGSVFFLENLRFLEGESAGNLKLA